VLAALTECFGGLAMIVGVLVRPAAVGLIFVMLVAIAKVHWSNGFFLNWSLEPGKAHGYEMNLALIGMALAVLVGGAGALSIDRWLRPGDMASGPCSSRRISQSPRSTSCATRTGLQHVLLGSVAENVVRLPPCPVLAVKHRGAPG